MQKGLNNGLYSCISKGGNPKSAWNTSDEVIDKAKRINNYNQSKETKLVGYKCPQCFKYHLKTVKLKK